MCKFDWEDDSPYLKTKKLENTEAAVQRCSYEKVFWKYAANLQENKIIYFQLIQLVV